MQGGTTQKRPCPFGAGTFFLDHLRMVSDKLEWYRAKAPPMRVFSSEAFFIRNEEWACGTQKAPQVLSICSYRKSQAFHFGFPKQHDQERFAIDN
ncbi:MAG: hypothetical protein EGQ71_02400 [Dialister sp.]|nr:hypothetical protein [Dialister sp.]